MKYTESIGFGILCALHQLLIGVILEELLVFTDKRMPYNHWTCYKWKQNQLNELTFLPCLFAMAQVYANVRQWQWQWMRMTKTVSFGVIYMYVCNIWKEKHVSYHQCDCHVVSPKDNDSQIHRWLTLKRTKYIRTQNLYMSEEEIMCFFSVASLRFKKNFEHMFQWHYHCHHSIEMGIENVCNMHVWHEITSIVQNARCLFE